MVHISSVLFSICSIVIVQSFCYAGKVNQGTFALNAASPTTQVSYNVTKYDKTPSFTITLSDNPTMLDFIVHSKNMKPVVTVDPYTLEQMIDDDPFTFAVDGKWSYELVVKQPGENTWKNFCLDSSFFVNPSPGNYEFSIQFTPVRSIVNPDPSVWHAEVLLYAKAYYIKETGTVKIGEAITGTSLASGGAGAINYYSIDKASIPSDYGKFQIFAPRTHDIYITDSIHPVRQGMNIGAMQRSYVKPRCAICTDEIKCSVEERQLYHCVYDASYSYSSRELEYNMYKNHPTDDDISNEYCFNSASSNNGNYIITVVAMNEMDLDYSIEAPTFTEECAPGEFCANMFFESGVIFAVVSCLFGTVGFIYHRSLKKIDENLMERPYPLSYCFIGIYGIFMFVNIWLCWLPYLFWTSVSGFLVAFTVFFGWVSSNRVVLIAGTVIGILNVPFSLLVWLVIAIAGAFSRTRRSAYMTALNYALLLLLISTACSFVLSILVCRITDKIKHRQLLKLRGNFGQPVAAIPTVAAGVIVPNASAPMGSPIVKLDI